MAIVIRILSPLLLCLVCATFPARGEEIRCLEGETVERRGVSLRVVPGSAAALRIDGPCRVLLHGLKVHGDRERNAQPQALPPSERLFADHYQANGVQIRGAVEVLIADSEFEEIAGFAILATRVRKAQVLRCRFRNSGSRNAKGRNNTTGGVLFEDGSADFTVAESTFDQILGNAVWTHSRYKFERNGPGVIRNNRFDGVARDAIQIGHAANVVVSGNRIRNIGFPVDAVDVEGGGTPVGIDTAGNVEASHYRGNELFEIDGKCFDLDGFHHGSLTDNTCVNARGPEAYPFGHYGIVMNNTNPDMQSVAVRIENNRFDGMRFGGIFVIGSGHVVRGNTLKRLHQVHCSEAKPQPGCTHYEGEPDLLRTGIYLGRRAERPAITRGNRIEANTISGWRMDKLCIGFAPGVRSSENRISGNVCRHEPGEHGRDKR